MDIWGRLIALFYPPKCIFCGCVVHYKEICCASCAAGMRQDGLRENPPRYRKHLDGIAAPLYYTGAARERMLAFKSQRHKDYAQYFAQLIEEEYRRCYALAQVDAVTFVPNFEPDGQPVYNPARVLARRLARRLGVPLCPALTQAREKKRQHTLAALDREGNVRGVFQANPELCRGKSFLLIDDVVTTGATLDACAAALKQAGARQVYGLGVLKGCRRIRAENAVEESTGM